MVSLRYAEGLSLTCLGVRIPKSTLHYWEMRHGDIVERVLRILFSLLSLIEYDYSIIDSTKFADWFRGCMSYSLMLGVAAHYSQSS